jgi:hypothetical protein
MRIKSLMFFMLMTVASLNAFAADAVQHDETVEVRKFVQSFYDWYIPETSKKGYGLGKMIKTHREMFNSQLANALIADQEAQDKVPGEIVGLDFDPFTDSQDPDNKYFAKKITAAGKRYRVEIFSQRTYVGEKPGVPILVAEVISKQGRWVFTNFIYGRFNSDLISELKRLAKERKGH